MTIRGNSVITGQARDGDRPASGQVHGHRGAPSRVKVQVKGYHATMAVPAYQGQRWGHPVGPRHKLVESSIHYVVGALMVTSTPTNADL